MNTSLHVVCPHCNTINRVPSSRLSQHPNCGKCQQSLFNGKPISLQQDQFDRHIERNDIPVLIDFWAQWCGPCKMMAPQFESAARLLEPRVRLAKVDTEAQPYLASRFTIQSIPMLVLFRHGKEIARNAGVISSQDLVKWVNKHLD
ncbi:thioredoxin TrxC [Legionella cherrii]|uniref:Thioredoxin n=1 Tax=Legionella cherrii TaxID=28084 RepID=A0A0W0SI68_9GAMM|nr:thioredoxin TrxC [Legionella cherrii]KTC82613.1 thioredoxin [Legionella cherrii]VEB35264.1 thioredoxin [Legionella cherrii]